MQQGGLRYPDRDLQQGAWCCTPLQGENSMKTLQKATNLIGLTTLLVLGGIQLCSADPAAELAAIHAVDDAWVNAFNAGDVGTMAGLYDEHAVLLPPGAPAAKGRAAIRAFFAKMVPAVVKDGLAFSLDAKPAGGAHGDFGWSSGNYVLKDKTGHVVDTGKYLSVSRKKDGKWLYLRDTWNSDGPLASTGPDASTKK
jgi:uncharacterized protein (TIGR02246 family)